MVILWVKSKAWVRFKVNDYSQKETPGGFILMMPKQRHSLLHTGPCICRPTGAGPLQH